MSEVPRGSASRSLPKLLFRISLITLIFFNAYAAIGYWSINHSIDRTQSEIETCREQVKMLDSIRAGYYNEALPEFENLESRVHQMRNQLRGQNEPFPILDHEFVITKIDGDSKSGARTIFISVPRSGKHQMRIQTTYRNEKLMDRQFDLMSGRGYPIKFTLVENKLNFLFPNEEPASIELDEFAFANRITNLRSALTGSQTFVSSNQPRWLLPNSKTKEYGVLVNFAYMSDLFEPEEHVSIKITAESDGPPTAAADNTATVLHLENSPWEPEFQFEDGRYIFER